MIEVRGLEFQYPGQDFRLEVEHLRLEAGERVGLLGPSGSGKTTLLHLLAGILHPHRGEVLIEGQTLVPGSESARRKFRLRRLGLIFQEFELVEYLDTRENILLPLRLAGEFRIPPEVDARLEKLARRLGIEAQLNSHPGSLSTGEKQRVAVARALLGRPRVLLADEPTSSLDGESRERVIEALEEIVRDDQGTLVLLTHDEALLERLDRTLPVMDFRRAARQEGEP